MAVSHVCWPRHWSQRTGHHVGQPTAPKHTHTHSNMCQLQGVQKGKGTTNKSTTPRTALFFQGKKLWWDSNQPHCAVRRQHRSVGAIRRISDISKNVEAQVLLHFRQQQVLKAFYTLHCRAVLYLLPSLLRHLSLVLQVYLVPYQHNPHIVHCILQGQTRMYILHRDCNIAMLLTLPVAYSIVCPHHERGDE